MIGVTGEGRNPDQLPMHARPTDLPPKAIGEPVRRLDPPVLVRVWVLFPRQGFVQVDGSADAYSPVAGHVRFELHGLSGDTWVWANAITRR